MGQSSRASVCIKGLARAALGCRGSPEYPESPVMNRTRRRTLKTARNSTTGEAMAIAAMVQLRLRILYDLQDYM